MTKGQFGLNLAAVAILTFVLSFFGFLEALVLLVAYALLIEKNPWLTRQTLQALYLKLIYNIVVTVVGWAFTLLRAFFGLFKATGIVNAMYNINSFINTVLYICLFLLCALAVIRLLKEQDADIPLAGNLADYTMNQVNRQATPVTPVAPAAPVNPAPVAPVAPIAPAAPAFNKASPFQAPPVVPEAAAAAEAEPETANGTWTCACGRENDGKFCMSCGNSRPI